MTIQRAIKQARNSRDLRSDTDDSIGFDPSCPNFGWFLYAKSYVGRYLALVKYDRRSTVQPEHDNPEKVSNRCAVCGLGSSHARSSYLPAIDKS